MSAYAIDFSDPLKGSFSIPAGGFNGPGGSSANTSLRLYGRGALEWGEAVDEDLVRLTENFASASSPSYAITGQTWVEQTLYYRNTLIGNVLQGWYYYDIKEVAPNKWKLLNGTGIVSGTASVSPIEGEYYSNGVTLFGYYSLGKYEPAAWLPRSYIIGGAVPISPAVTPQINVHVYNAATATWDTPSGTIVSGTTPSLPLTGMLWYNTATGNLLVYTGAAWQEILGPTGAALSTASGNLEMGSFRITGMANAVGAQDATTLAQVTSLVSGGGAGVFLPLSGGTLIGSVTFSAGTVTHSVNSTFTTLSSSGLASLNSISTAGAITSGGTLTASGALVVGTTASIGSTLTVSGAANINGGQLSMNSSKIVNLATGTNANDAVNVSQMTAAIAGAGVGAGVPIIWTSGVYKAGDIAIDSGKIYIANAGGSGGPPGGNWKQVYPAVYA